MGRLVVKHDKIELVHVSFGNFLSGCCLWPGLPITIFFKGFSLLSLTVSTLGSKSFF